MRAGDVLLVYCERLRNPHDKFVVCACPRRKWFFFINSEPRRRVPDTQVPLREYELEALSHDSWIDTSKIVSFSDAELMPALRNRNRRKGMLSNALRLRVKTRIRQHKLLPEHQAQVVEANF